MHYAAQTKEGRSALHLACQSGDIKSVKILIEAGIDPDLRTKRQKKLFLFNSGGETAAELTEREANAYLDRDEFAEEKKRKDILEFLRSRSKKNQKK